MANMLKKIGAHTTVSSDPVVIIGKADKLILLGVGAFNGGMKNMKLFGLIQVLNKRVLEDKVPILAVCLGMQLLGMRSEEGQVPGRSGMAGRRNYSESVREALILV